MQMSTTSCPILSFTLVVPAQAQQAASSAQCAQKGIHLQNAAMEVQSRSGFKFSYTWKQDRLSERVMASTSAKNLSAA